MKDQNDLDAKMHWDNAYATAPSEKLGWYEAAPTETLTLIKETGLTNEARILNVGAGATTLVDELLELGHQNILANDISPLALDKLKARLGKDKDKVQWIIDDLIHPYLLNKIDPIDLWIDRAVLHFFTKSKEQKAYFDLLKQLVKVEGYVILATFNLSGATKCSGLPVHRYDVEMLSGKLGSAFSLVKSFDFTFMNPNGDPRTYVYTLYKRVGS